MIFSVQRAISWSSPLESWWELEAELLFVSLKTSPVIFRQNGNRVLKKHPKTGKGGTWFNLMLSKDRKVCHLNKRKFLNVDPWTDMPLIRLPLSVLVPAGKSP